MLFEWQIVDMIEKAVKEHVALQAKLVNAEGKVDHLLKKVDILGELFHNVNSKFVKVENNLEKSDKLIQYQISQNEELRVTMNKVSAKSKIIQDELKSYKMREHLPNDRLKKIVKRIKDLEDNYKHIRDENSSNLDENNDKDENIKKVIQEQENCRKLIEELTDQFKKKKETHNEKNECSQELVQPVKNFFSTHLQLKKMGLSSSGLRPIVIDGSNVAYCHGEHKNFSLKGISIAIQHFKDKGHNKIVVYLPEGRKPTTKEELGGTCFLLYTPKETSDDIFILDYIFLLGKIIYVYNIYVHFHKQINYHLYSSARNLKIVFFPVYLYASGITLTVMRLASFWMGIKTLFAANI